MRKINKLKGGTMDIIKMAYKFAANAHAGQVRKYTGEPYINHPVAVASILQTATNPSFSPEVIAAALLHDVVEDTDVTLSEIEDIFGSEVATLVEMVTGVSILEDGNRRIRKEIDRQHLDKGSFEGKSIKLADLIDNSYSITEHDSVFAVVYMKEKKDLMTVLSSGHPDLFIAASEIIDHYYITEKTAQ